MLAAELAMNVINRWKETTEEESEEPGRGIPSLVAIKSLQFAETM
jgi:hypothetical protein